MSKRIPRNPEEIQQEYQSLCMQLGQFHYQMNVLPEEIDRLNREIKTLNLEMLPAREYWSKQVPPPPVAVPENVPEVVTQPA